MTHLIPVHLAFLVLAFFLSTAIEGLAVEPQRSAHAHNDYEHKRPLFDALDHGFCSVEADVFAIGGELRVAHYRFATRPEKTLQKLYLDPLLERVRKNGGRVFPNGPQFMLLIDFKTEGEPTYQLLRKILSDYRELLVAGKGVPHPPVSIVISGDRPLKAIEADKDRVVGIDGRLSDLDCKLPSDLLPLISDNWKTHFRWRGKGEMPAGERTKLREIVAKAHIAGRKVRFWATPENENLWRELMAAGVDHINTDQLGRLERFLKARADENK